MPAPVPRRDQAALHRLDRARALSEFSDFAADSAVEPLGAGRYRGTISSAWSAPPGPNGGYVAALILRSIRAEIGDPGRRPRALTVHYLRPPSPGEIEVEVTVERSGRNASSCSARLLQGGKTMSLALAVLSGDFDSVAEWRTPPPAVPPPDEVEPATFPGEGAPPIFFQTDTRPVFGPPIFSGGDEALNGGWVRTHLPTRLDPELLTLYADIWWPAPFARIELQPVSAPTLELTVHFRERPPEGEHEFVLGRFESTTLVGGIFEASGEIWAEDGRLLAQSRQTALLRSLAPAS